VGQPLQLNTPAYRALSATNRYGLVTVRHVARRYHPTVNATSLRYVQDAFTTLTRNGFVLQREVIPQKRGRGPHIYSIADAGRTYLRSKGEDVLVRRAPSDFRNLHAREFLHPEAITDFLVSADLAAAAYPSYLTILQLWNEQVVRAHMRNTKPLFDSLIQFHVADDAVTWYPLMVAVEIDNGTEYRISFQQKITALVDWSEIQFPHLFGDTALQIACVSLPGAKRQQDMRLWTEQLLAQLSKTQLFHLFRFTSSHPATTDPYDMFFADSWCIPFSTEPVSLFTQLQATP